MAHGLVLNNLNNASIDSDQDGASNLQEYLSGTDPRNASSILRVTGSRTSDSSFQITFNGVITKTYRLERAPSPTGPWSVLENHIPGSTDPIEVTNSASAVPSTGFYRVVVE